MKKNIAMVIAKEKFRDEEYQEPRKVFDDAGFNVTVFSTSLDISKGMYGFEVKPDKLLTNINPEEFDAIVFVGGGGSAEYFNNQKAHEIAQKFNEMEKIVAAICIAPKTLAKAGLLDNVKFCCFPSVKKDIIEMGGSFNGEGVCIDGNIITGTGPEYAQEFGKAIKKSLN